MIRAVEKPSIAFKRGASDGLHDFIVHLLWFAVLAARLSRRLAIDDIRTNQINDSLNIHFSAITYNGCTIFRATVNHSALPPAALHGNQPIAARLLGST